MNISSMILFACLAGTALAQENTPLPKKDPFAGFGSSLDRRPGGQAGGTLLDRGPGGSVTTPSIGAGNSKPGEIALPGNWSAPLPESSGGHSLEIQDLKALLGPYGKPDDSLATPPGVMIYPGIRYLAPQAEAARILGGLRYYHQPQDSVRRLSGRIELHLVRRQVGRRFQPPLSGHRSCPPNGVSRVCRGIGS
jgi:hypothetical protein